MQWTAFLQLENSIENPNDNLTVKTSDVWTLPIDERLVIFSIYLYYKKLFFHYQF